MLSNTNKNQIRRVDDIEKQLQDSTALLNEYNSIKEIYNQFINLKTQLNQETFKRVIEKFQEFQSKQYCTLRLHLQFKSIKALMQFNSLQKLVKSIQQHQRLNNNHQTINKAEINQFKQSNDMNKLQKIALLAIKPLKINKIFVCNFLVEQTCELIGFYQRLLYKNKDIDYQQQQLKSIYMIHFAYDLTIRANEFQTIINHYAFEKPIPYSYYIKLSEQFRLISGKVFTISLTKLYTQPYNVSFFQTDQQLSILEIMISKIQPIFTFQRNQRN
ncbi:unnamed protein product [Paramecium octaurelia]|uniref:Uncharacterized protein n=1 Tax=Paramecium octaurelia TaxID=43137 RepID=A0A8S1YQ90_PAROT|nr:unnamed protein product [Paramecium octaurelia]